MTTVETARRIAMISAPVGLIMGLEQESFPTVRDCCRVRARNRGVAIPDTRTTRWRHGAQLPQSLLVVERRLHPQAWRAAESALRTP